MIAAEVRSVPELAETDWARERGAFVDVDTGRGEMITIPQSPWRFRDADAGVKPSVGYRGENNRQVLSEFLGFSPEELDDLENDAVISSRPPRWSRDSDS